MSESTNYETLFNTRGGRRGKRSKVVASHKGKYSEPHKYPTRRHTRVRQNIDFPKEMTKAYLRLTRELDRIQKIKQDELSWLCELYDMYLEDQDRQLKEETGETDWVI